LLSLKKSELLKINNVLTYRRATLLYFLFFCVLTHSYWFGGEVIAPYRQYADLGLPDTSGATNLKIVNLLTFPQHIFQKSHHICTESVRDG